MITLTTETNEFSVGATPIPVGKTVLVNYDPHNLRQNGLSLIAMKKVEIRWCTQIILMMNNGLHQKIRKKLRERRTMQSLQSLMKTM